jgi:hypothetical protein
MCKEMPVIPVNRVVDPKRIICRKKWRAEEEEKRHKRSLTPSNAKFSPQKNLAEIFFLDARSCT